MTKERFKVHEGVFDEFTLKTLEVLKRKHYFDEFGSAIKTGKEGDVYLAMSDPDLENKEGKRYAIKLFRMTSANFKKISSYIQRDYRFKTIRGNTRKVILMWAQKEYRNLLKAYQAGVRVPYPYKQMNNVIVMDYISGGMLKDVVLENPEEFFDDLLEQLYLFRHDAQLIHGDLSEFNILVEDQLPVIIDVGQAMTIKNEDDFKEFYDLYVRDVERIVYYFTKRYQLKITLDDVLKRLDLEESNN